LILLLLWDGCHTRIEFHIFVHDDSVEADYNDNEENVKFQSQTFPGADPLVEAAQCNKN
jgi:hypothetical protein